MRVDPNAEQAPPEEATAPGSGGSDPASTKHWSPLSTRKARWSWGLMIVFSIIYFTTAILTSAEFADLAATLVLGLPLGFWLGIGVIISGLVITRVYLMKVEE